MTAFPAAPLDLRCELDLAGAWTDVSSYVYQRDGGTPPVALARGRADESSQANPGTATWEWNNRDGRFSPKNPLSPYYGTLGRNTPVRWSVPAQSNYMRLEASRAAWASCPDSAPLEITGDTDIRIDLRQSDYQGAALCSKSDPSGTHAWLLERLSDGTLAFFWWDSGNVQHSARSSVPAPIGRVVLRVTLAVSTGTVTFWTAAGGNIASGPWAQLGAAAVSGATSVFAATAPVRVGDPASAPFGRCYEFRLYSGVGGTLEADAAFSAQAAGATSWADAQGNTWTLNGTAEISARDYRWHGQMSAQPPKWDVTGRDMSVAAQAGGPLRLISQGQAPLMSPMKRAMLLLSGALAPVAFWPMEDAAGATSLGPSLGGVTMYFSGSPQLSSSSAFLCSAPLPVTNGASFAGRVPAASWTSNVTRFLMGIPSGGEPNNAVIAQVYGTGTVALLSLYYDTGGALTLTGWAASGAQLFTSGPVAMGPVLGGQLRVSMELQPSGSNVAWSMVTLAPGAATGTVFSGTLTSASVGAVTQVLLNPNGTLTGTVFGHCSVQAVWDSLADVGGALTAWQGETAATRFARLAAENGYQSRIIGAPAASAAMGAQAIDTLGNLLQSCEDADRGQIFEPRQALAVGYRTLASMYNQAVKLSLDYSQSEPGGADGSAGDSGLDPTYDDLLTRNDWTLTRSAGTGPDGGTYQAQLDDGSEMSITGVGDYADTLSVNVEADSQLPNTAWWMVRVGTVDEARWPAIPLNLARPEMAVLWWNALDADIGDLVEMDNAPDLVVYDPVRQLAFQQTENLGGKHYAMAFSAVPASPYTVAQAGTAAAPVSHAATAGSQLAAGCSSTATSLSVATTSGSIWTTSAGAFPFSVMVAGEEMTVTNITGSSSPQAFTVTRSVNGVVKAQLAAAAVQVYPVPVAAL